MAILARRVGRYVVHREIAAGGMGVVSLAKVVGDGHGDRIVAVKRLLDSHARDPQIVAMLFDEARIAGHIDHPNVVTVHEVAEVEGEVLLAMEYVEGESLATLLATSRARGEVVPIPIVVGVLAGVLAGLDAAHEAADENGLPLGIVHRDVSPQNVLVDVAGRSRVTDFGVAKAIGRMQATTEHGSIKGKLRYMSPEQFAGERVDRRADVWAAGVMLWEMLTGEPLFEEATAAMRFFGSTGQVPPPSTRRPVPPALEAIALRALSRSAGERFATAREMAAALAATHAGAPPEEIGAWVKRLAADVLERRAAYVAELAALDPAAVTEELVPTKVERMGRAADGSESPVSRSSPPGAARPRRARRLAALGIGGLLVAAVAGAGVIYTRQTPLGTEGPARASHETTTRAAAAPPTAMIPPEPAPAPSPGDAPTSSGASPPASAAAAVPPRRKAGIRPRPSASPSPAATPRDDPELGDRK